MPRLRRGDGFPVRRSADLADRGNGVGAAVSLYHNFNPGTQMPLNGIVRGAMNYHFFNDSSDTADDFVLPNSQPFYTLRTGPRWGGKEPVLCPRLAMELSAWYDLSALLTWRKFN